MSRRTSESNKAITEAWEKEQKLVSEGKGTRDWTPEQQRDIIERGKAYDDDGKAFRGHHMRSVSICPEEQGNPYNIQFLSHEEHIEAHVICWQPTNWYYDPVTRNKIDFGDGPIIPCKVIELSNPVSLSCIQQHKSINTEKEDKSEEREKCSVDDRSDRSDVNQHGDNVLKATKPKGTDKPVSTGGFWEGVKRVVKNAGDFVAEHKEEIGLGALAILGTVAEIAINSNDDSDDEGIGVSHEGIGDYSYSSFSDDCELPDSLSVPDEREYPDTHSSPQEHTVPRHGQHYHTKDGVIWKEKEAYTRGRNHPDEE